MSLAIAMTRREFSALIAAATIARAQNAPPRKRRADSFFGLHFDLHPNPGDPALGRDVSEAMVERIIERARPDYIQYDAKGHTGWLGWPSEVGPSAPHIVQDSLAIYRRVTARLGVALYIHFSGVWDDQSVKSHPEWARLNAMLESDGHNTSTFSDYVTARMIPQLREAATKYDLDGAWIDGECWALQPDYHRRALDEFGADPPKSPEDPKWPEFLELQRESFRRYVRRYVEALHESHPKFQIASNWLYSTFVPEKPELPVDFLSGDYLGNASISTARLEARYLGQTGRPWDLMAWGFQQGNSVHKPAVQLMQEAAVVLGQGGGFQVYYQPSRAGRFEDSLIETMGRVGDFCRARQAVSHKTEAVPQIGVVFAGESLYRTANRCFGGWGKALDGVRGWIDGLAASQYSVDVIPDWRLTELLPQHRFVVLPEWTSTSPTLWKPVLAWVERGGILLLSGAENARLVLPLRGEAADHTWFCGGNEVLANLRGKWQDVEADPARVIEWRYPEMDTSRDGRPLAVRVAYGTGEVVAVPGPLGSIYAQTHAPAVRDLIRRLVRPRFTPLVEVDAPPTVELALRRRDGRLLVHLLNTSNMQVAGDYAAVDFIPAVGPVTLRFRSGVRSARLLPGDVPLSVKGDAVSFERLEIHAVVAAETRVVY